jgi:glycosyltransferase involved in cell wall biosynthesis
VAFQESGRPLPDSHYDSYPLVSVIIPYFNHGRYLEDAILSSLLACSYPMEIIVVDDGSTDSKSVAVVNELSEDYKFRLVNQINAGRSAARNAALQRARGKFIQFLDADDLLDKHKIDIQVAEFQADPTIAICLCDYDMCNGEGQDRFAMQPSKIAGFSFSREDFLLRWERGLSVAIHSALFRRELLDQIRFRQVTRAGHEDWIFWIELASHSPKFHFNPAALAVYRIHGQNTTANNEIMGLDFLRAAMYVMHIGLNTCDNFWQATTEHFRKAYLGYIKQDAIALSRIRPVN